VGDAGEGHTRNVPRCRGPTTEVPDHLVGVGELVNEEAATVLLGEDAGIAPSLAGQRSGVLLRDRANVEDVNDQQVTRLRAFHGERTAEDMHSGQGCIADVIGGVVVVDGTVKPFPAVHPK